jgi:hypothetical protein
MSHSCLPASNSFTFALFAFDLPEARFFATGDFAFACITEEDAVDTSSLSSLSGTCSWGWSCACGESGLKRDWGLGASSSLSECSFLVQSTPALWVFPVGTALCEQKKKTIHVKI